VDADEDEGGVGDDRLLQCTAPAVELEGIELVYINIPCE